MKLFEITLTVEQIYALPVDADGWRTMPEGYKIHIGLNVTIGASARIGAWATIGESARDPIDLGSYEGYRKIVCEVKGIAWIGAGCQWFSLAAAIEHWKERADRPITRAAMQLALAIAKEKGWKVE